jgi:glycosyltransferase involved in cell wall biosynthesis
MINLSDHCIDRLSATTAKLSRLLIVATSLPYPPTNGYAMRIWALLNCLAAVGCETDLICFGDPTEAHRHEAQLNKVCRTVDVVVHETISLSAGLAVRKRLGALLSGYPYAVAQSRSEVMREKIKNAIKNGRVDAVFLEETNLLTNLPSEISVPLIVDHHNVEHLLLERYAARAENWIRAAYASLEARKVRDWEKTACTRASAVLVCSRHDQMAFREFAGDVPVIVIPNVIDDRSYVPAYKDDGYTILYAGGMDWLPNRDAVEYFIRTIFPLLRERAPEARFVVAGRGPSPKFLKQFAAVPGVEFTGTVADMRPVLAKAAVCVVPLRMGSGTRLKILEAAAMGKAVVSTSIGAEGLEFVNGEHILLADEPTEFAAAVANLMADTQRRRKLGHAARKWLEDQYSFPILRRALQGVLRSSAGNCTGEMMHE